MVIVDVVGIVEGTLDVVVVITITITIPTTCINHDTKFHHPLFTLVLPRLVQHHLLFKDYHPRIIHNHPMSNIIFLQLHMEVDMGEWRRTSRSGMNLIRRHLRQYHCRCIELHRLLHKHHYNCHSLRLAMLDTDMLHHRCRCQ